MASIEIKIVSSFELAWCDKKSGGDMDGAFYNPTNIPVGFSSMGSYGQGNYNSPNGSVLVVKELETGALAYPTGFNLVYSDKGSGADLDGSFLEPIAPKGYVAMGILCVRGYSQPPNTSVVCLRSDLAIPSKVGSLIWSDKGAGVNMNGSFWNVVQVGAIQTGLFAGVTGHSPDKAAPLYGINPSAV